MANGARGGAVTMLGEVSKLVIQMVALIVLSRLLTPADFGLIAMVSVILALGELLRDFGIASAALSAPSLSRQQASNLFWASNAVGLLLSVALLVCTPLIVDFYNSPQLASVIPIFALVLVLNGAQVQFRVNLARSMRFRALVVTDLIALIIAFVIAVSCAMSGMGYFALALQALAYALLQLLLRAVAARWLPSLPRGDGETASLLRSGSHIGLSQLLTYAASNADTISIGAQWGSTALGYYNRAFQLLTTPLRATVGPLTNVVIPTATRARAEGQDVDMVLLRIQTPLALLTAWIFMASAGVSPVLIPLVLGEQWVASVPIFQALAIGGAVQALSYVNLWAFLLHEKTRSLLHYNILTKSLTVLVVVLASFVSVQAVAWAYSIMLVISWPIGLLWLRFVAGQDFWSYFRNGARVLFAATLGYLCSIAIVEGLQPVANAWVALFVGVVTSSLVFTAVLCVLPSGRRELRSAVAMARSILRGAA
nr:lipopolysaccharide biosynthesis protein [Microbacterium sp.]